jgi:hypothetical protein
MENKQKENIPECCRQNTGKNNGFWQGVFFGLIPHSFCLAFLLFSILGVTVMSAFFQKFLLIPHFFEFLLGFSILAACFSSIYYLKRLNLLSITGIKQKKQYLIILFVTTIGINFLFLKVIFPQLANIQIRSAQSQTSTQANMVVISTQIPCSGHAPLISGELLKINGVTKVFYNKQGNFEVSFNSSITNPEQILNASIFQTYPAKIAE